MADNPETSITAEALASQLTAEGLLSERDRADFERVAMARQGDSEPPLFLRLVLALGAFLTTSFFVGFLFAAEVISERNGEGMLAWGAFFIAAAVGLYFGRGRGGGGLGHAWLEQLALASMLTGKLIFLIGAMVAFGPQAISPYLWTLTGVAAAVTVAAYPLFPMQVDRFISVFATLMIAFAAIVEHQWRMYASTGLMMSSFIVQLAVAGAMMLSGRVPRAHMAVAYALIASLCVIAGYWSLRSEITRWSGAPAVSLVFEVRIATAALALALIALIAWAAGGVEKLKTEPVALASAGALALAFLSAPGVLLAMALMILGYARRDHILLVGGAALLPAFITLYYYNLDMNFMAKSAVLVGSGALLLAGRAYIRVRGWDAGREEFGGVR